MGFKEALKMQRAKILKKCEKEELKTSELAEILKCTKITARLAASELEIPSRFEPCRYGEQRIYLIKEWKETYKD